MYLPDNKLPSGGQIVGRMICLGIIQLAEEKTERWRVYLKRNAIALAKECKQIGEHAPVPTKRIDKVEAKIMKTYQEGLVGMTLSPKKFKNR